MKKTVRPPSNDSANVEVYPVEYVVIVLRE